MRKIFNIILLLALTFSLSSCFTMMALAASADASRAKLGNKWMKTSVKTLQRITSCAALATTKEGDIICLVTDFSKEYYDGLTRSGYFKRKGTLSYISTSGANKTVLVYVFKKDLKKLEKYADELQKKNEKIVVDESQMNYVEI